MIEFKYGSVEIVAWEFEIKADGEMVGSIIVKVAVNQVGTLSPKSCAELCVVYLEHAPSFLNEFDIVDPEIEITNILFCKDFYWIVANVTGRDNDYEEFDPLSVYEPRSAD